MGGVTETVWVWVETWDGILGGKTESVWVEAREVDVDEEDFKDVWRILGGVTESVWVEAREVGLGGGEEDFKDVWRIGDSDVTVGGDGLRMDLSSDLRATN